MSGIQCHIDGSGTHNDGSTAMRQCDANYDCIGVLKTSVLDKGSFHQLCTTAGGDWIKFPFGKSQCNVVTADSVDTLKDKLVTRHDGVISVSDCGPQFDSVQLEFTPRS